MTWMMGFALMLHTLSAIVWVGGMFFAYLIVRPVIAQQLEVPARLQLWRQLFRKFFLWVWHAIALLWLTGGWLLYIKGGFAKVHWSVHAMLSAGLLMTLIFIYLVFFPYKKLTLAVDKHDWAQGGSALALMRKLIATNLILGLFTAALGSAGVYLQF